MKQMLEKAVFSICILDFHCFFATPIDFSLNYDYSFSIRYLHMLYSIISVYFKQNYNSIKHTVIKVNKKLVTFLKRPQPYQNLPN
jgi:hypothetical protein